MQLRYGLVNNKPIAIDGDFVKKNLFSILACFLDADNIEHDRVSSTFLSELKRSKMKFPPESSAHFTHELLLKLTRSLYSSRAYPSLFLQRFVRTKRFIEMCVFGGDGDCPPLIAFNGEHKLVIDYICLTVLTNTLKLFRSQSYNKTYDLLGLLNGRIFL